MNPEIRQVKAKVRRVWFVADRPEPTTRARAQLDYFDGIAATNRTCLQYLGGSITGKRESVAERCARRANENKQNARTDAAPVWFHTGQWFVEVPSAVVKKKLEHDQARAAAAFARARARQNNDRATNNRLRWPKKSRFTRRR